MRSSRSFYPSPNIIRIIKSRVMRQITRVKIKRNAYKVSVRKPDGKKTTRMDDIIMYCKKI
jgi:hypothetical protein